jgi:RNA polymerase sigma-70 factor (ECF subfamily)
MRFGDMRLGRIARMADDRSREYQLWIDRARAGDLRAREELLACASERLLRLTRKMLHGFPGVHRFEETDDVFQNAALRLHRALQQVTPPSARDFLRLAAVQIRRELIDLARHYRGPGACPPPAGETAGTPVEPQDTTRDQTRLGDWGEFHSQIAALPDEEREVFDLLWYQGLTQPEAAAVLQVPLRTVKRRWQDARRRLYRAMDGRMPGPA